MTTKMNKLALAIGALVMAGGAMAQSTATDTGTANATVIVPITIAATETLEFGTIVAAAGTVTVAAADGARTNSVPALSAGTQEGTVRAGTFTVGGQEDYTYSITLPVNGDVTLGDGATGTIAIDDFTVAGTGVTGAVGARVGVLTDGEVVLSVGAKLTVAALQAAGAYTGTYDVTVAYN
ncbi:MAG: hypothetical protein JWR60_1772 [Polaromonas sp.]|nr:hypothetical protein [Polaromonas sp.]